MVAVGSHSGIVVCKEGYIGVSSNVGFHAGVLRCKDIVFTDSKLIKYKSGVYTCNKLIVQNKLTIVGPVSFYGKKGTRVLQGPLELDKNFSMDDRPAKQKKTGYTREELDKMSFSELKKIGMKLRVKGRSREGLIKDILDIQAGKKKPEF